MKLLLCPAIVPNNAAPRTWTWVSLSFSSAIAFRVEVAITDAARMTTITTAQTTAVRQTPPLRRRGK